MTGLSARTSAQAIVALLVAATLGAQAPMSGATPIAGVRVLDATAGSMTERTLLLTELLSANSASTFIRPIARWSDSSSDNRATRAFWYDVTTPVATVWINSTRAAVDRDGAVWQGRGLTMAVTGGAVANAGPLNVALRPIVFGAQNSAYSPVLGAAPADLRNPTYADLIDLPYRFGQRAYGIAAPGESWISLNAWKLSAGLTSASQTWGPAHYYPLILGTEGAGYPRLFMEGRQLPVGVGSLNVQWSFGRLEASRESTRAPGDRSRLASAFLASITPAGLRGLEVGVGRFFHSRFEQGSINMETAMLPFQRLFKGKDSGEISSISLNQLASAYARIAPPGAGVEVYLEFFREDHNANLRDFFGEPDHESAYTIGVRRAWRSGHEVRGITLETVNGRMSHLARVRPEPPIYLHDDINEGHTYLGQALGSTAAMGGGAYMIAFDVVGPALSYLFEGEVRRLAQTAEGGTLFGQGTGLFTVRVSRWREHGAVSIGAGFTGSTTLGKLPGNNLGIMLAARGGWF